MKSVGIYFVLAIASAVPAFAEGVSFTCDPTIAADFRAGVCTFLNGSFASLYNNTFTNANASIYIEATNGGLADSTSGGFNFVTYSAYQSALQSESTDAAKAFVPASEPAIFGSSEVDVTSALAAALGITNASHGGGSPSGIAGVTATGATCIGVGSGGCYNGLIQVNDPTDLFSQTGGQGYTYRTLGGSTNGTTLNYDFFSIVEHETDEILGTASCIDIGGSPAATTNDCVGNASAIDLFRYSSAGVRAYSSLTPTNQYFSPDGGVTDTNGNLYNTTKSGEDWADFSQGCTFVQDAEGCPTNNPVTSQFDITTDGPGHTPGPEVAILNAVGYDLKSASTIAPEPGTMALLGLGLGALGFAAYRRRLASEAAA